MLKLIERIRERLMQGAYANEAAISHGVVTPLLNALGWDSADPDQLVPEFSIQRGRVDFALFGLGHRPAVFIEVKGVGRAVEGDRQLFEYAFHQGVPLCVLTDGREWSFYLPSGQGSYEDRRVYRLQLDDRDPLECQRILTRYLARDRVRDNTAFEDAQRDYRDAAGKREAAASIPRAWSELLAEPEDFFLDAVGDKAEALCGYKPSSADVLQFLRDLGPSSRSTPTARKAPLVEAADVAPDNARAGEVPEIKPASDRAITFTLLGVSHSCPTASVALVEILAVLAAKDPDRIPALAEEVRTRKRSSIARSPAEINPGRPDLARAVDFAPGWLVGLNIANREKMSIIRSACAIYELRMPEDLDIVMPNA